MDKLLTVVKVYKHLVFLTVKLIKSALFSTSIILYFKKRQHNFQFPKNQTRGILIAAQSYLQAA